MVTSKMRFIAGGLKLVFYAFLFYCIFTMPYTTKTLSGTLTAIDHYSLQIDGQWYGPFLNIYDFNFTVNQNVNIVYDCKIGQENFMYIERIT